jgi:hypothetical protein
VRAFCKVIAVVLVSYCSPLPAHADERSASDRLIDNTALLLMQRGHLPASTPPAMDTSLRSGLMVSCPPDDDRCRRSKLRLRNYGDDYFMWRDHLRPQWQD